MGTWNRLRNSQFQRTELLFVTGAAGVAIAIGAFGRDMNAQLYFLFVPWAALVGMMIPRLRETRAATHALAAANWRESNQRVVNHDVSSALLTIEGGIAALRFLYHEGETMQGTDGVVAARVESIAHAIETEIRRIRRIHGPTSSPTEVCDISTTVEPLIALHQATGANVQADLGFPAQIAMSSDDVARVVSNLLDNCARHAPQASIYVSGFKVGDTYQLNVADDGPGLSADVVDRAFEHGVSSRVGGGLGLYSVRSIVETCGGSVVIDSTPAGTTVRLQLPTVEVYQPPSRLFKQQVVL